MNIDMTTGEVITPFLRTEYNYDMYAASVESGLACTDESMAQQQFKEECDINTIVRRFGLTGEVPNNFTMPQSGDFTETVTDFQTAMNLITEARSQFMLLPGELRAEFENDPQRLMTFMENPANREKAIELGLINPPPPTPAPAPDPAPGTVTT